MSNARFFEVASSMEVEENESLRFRRRQVVAEEEKVDLY